ncbi:unnamed protein product [Toxocara canis]|uniref:Protein BRICK1 n=1 Tax=Toxocara canis TaxID=6265 RepID=A0A183UFB1_TOXCA|nr:unnamed protein product [Toxocara canis]
MNAGGLTVSSVQRQLREDWDNREYGQVVADNVKHIADFLSNFELSCRSKIATLNDKLNLLERKVEFLEARVRCCSFLNVLVAARPYVIKRRNPKLMATSRITKFASGASAIAREVTPIVSSSREQARASVLAVYKEL